MMDGPGGVITWTALPIVFFQVQATPSMFHEKVIKSSKLKAADNVLNDPTGKNETKSSQLKSSAYVQYGFNLDLV